MTSRREFMRLASATALVPLLTRISPATAAAAQKVPLTDPGAVALKYVEIATDATRTDKMGVPGSEQLCNNCRFYTTSDEANWGGCALFQNRLVAGEGWCVGWVPQA